MRKGMRKTDFIVALMLIGFSIAMIFFIIPAWCPEAGEFGAPSDVLPITAMAVTGILSLLLLLKNLPGTWKKEDEDPAPINRGSWIHLAKYAGLFACGTLVFSFLGYIAGGIVTIAAGMVVCGERRPALISAVAVAGPLIMYAALWYGLSMPLP